MSVKSKCSNNKYNEKQVCLINYLKSQLSAGNGFFKAKYISLEIGLSSKVVGANMAILADICPDFSIV